MSNKNILPKYIKILVKNHPKIYSGRKNFKDHHIRIIKTINLIKKYFNKK